MENQDQIQPMTYGKAAEIRDKVERGQMVPLCDFLRSADMFGQQWGVYQAHTIT